MDEPFPSYKHFACLSLGRQGIKDSESAKRRVGNRGKDRHAADMGGDGDSCQKAFWSKCGLKPGNTHTCSPIYMPDESLGSTPGVAAQAADVSHSIAVVNRTSLVCLAPANYMVRKMVQVAMMNVRKLQRLYEANTSAENDHLSLSPSHHARLSGGCLRGSSCSCQSTRAEGGSPDGQHTAMAQVTGVPVIEKGSAPVVNAVVGDLAAAGEERLDDNSHAQTCDGPPGALVNTASVVPPGASTSSDVRPPVGHGDATTASDGDTVPQPGVGGASLDLRESGGVFIGFSGQLSAPLSSAPLTPDRGSFVDSLVKMGSSQPVRPINKAWIRLCTSDFQIVCYEQWLTDDMMNSFVELFNHREGQARSLPRRAAQQLPAAPQGLLGSTIPRAFMFNTQFFFAALCAPGLLRIRGCTKVDKEAQRVHGWRLSSSRSSAHRHKPLGACGHQLAGPVLRVLRYLPGRRPRRHNLNLVPLLEDNVKEHLGPTVADVWVL